MITALSYQQDIVCTDVCCDERSHVAADNMVGVLAQIHDDAINLTIWQRGLDAALAAEAALMCTHDGEALRLGVAVVGLDTALPAAMAAGGWPTPPYMAADIVMLAAQFGRIMGCNAVDLRLEVITGDACRKYHADYVTARLITSYAGPGSQWISDAQAAALAGGADADQFVPEQLQAGDVALFKGRRWTPRPIIHRSPPIAGNGQRRLVLVINPAEANGQP